MRNKESYEYNIRYRYATYSCGPTLNRFYSLHYLLPFIIAALTLTHLVALHDAGGTNPLGISSNKSLINFHPYYSFKDILGFIILFLALLFFVFFMPNVLGQWMAVLSSNRYNYYNTICWNNLYFIGTHNIYCIIYTNI